MRDNWPPNLVSNPTTIFSTAKRRRGRVDVFTRAGDGGWEASHRIRLPKQAEFEDYAK
jgi:hypothetical protein